MQRISWRFLALLLCSLLCISSAAAITTEELLEILSLISTDLQTAQTESEKAQGQSERALEIAETLQNDQVPQLHELVDELRSWFDAYEKRVSNEINRLTAGLYVAGGAALLAILTALIALFN